MKTLTGTVNHASGTYFVIACPDAPLHLRTIYLTPRQMLGATVGDRVTLGYQVTPYAGLWNVVAVEKKESA